MFFREVEVRIQKQLTLSFNRVLVVDDQRDVIVSAVVERMKQCNFIGNPLS